MVGLHWKQNIWETLNDKKAKLWIWQCLELDAVYRLSSQLERGSVYLCRRTAFSHQWRRLMLDTVRLINNMAEIPRLFHISAGDDQSSVNRRNAIWSRQWSIVLAGRASRAAENCELFWSTRLPTTNWTAVNSATSGETGLNRRLRR